MSHAPSAGAADVGAQDDLRELEALAASVCRVDDERLPKVPAARHAL